MEKEKEIFIFEKECFKFVRIDKNKYKLSFSMENKNIILSNILDFNLIKLIYDLNGDIYEKVNIEQINKNEAVCTLLIKNFFEDLGFSQKYSHLHIEKLCEKDKVIFKSKTIHSEKPTSIPEDAELLYIKDMINICDIITPYKIDFAFYINFDSEMVIPNFSEKLVGVILNKIFKRVKQFIENIRL
uniref:START domain-containing protein n=1 Tax=viral metagenome TaxID=1070528 RepID=A0A6C0EPC1_9ZZZZ